MKSYATNRFNAGDRVFIVLDSLKGTSFIRQDIIQFVDFYENVIIYTLSEGIRKSSGQIYADYDTAFLKGEFRK